MVGYGSRFGGLWIDQSDEELVAARISAIDSPELRWAVESFARNGFVVLRNAVSHAVIDAYLAEYAQATAGRGDLQMEVPLQGGRQTYDRTKSLLPGSKMLDIGMLLPHGPELSFAPRINEFLNAVFDGPALAMQMLHFEVGSTQAIHQDTAYVVVEHEPLHLAASWVALEDIQPGSGELVYYPGGHRFVEHAYHDGASKHWDPGRDGHEPHDAHLRGLTAEADRLGVPARVFRPLKGDALIWHADLPHGGGAIERPGISRRSVVTHYCPVALEPHYLQFMPKSWQHKVPTVGGNALCSMYYPPEMFATSFEALVDV